MVAEGAGLNPLLRHPSMMIHPPMLYSGYTLFAIPFAFAVGALITRRLDAEWIRLTRPFTLAAWFFLGVGILLGARWSYTELGWGGYWAWDPVENASLMPWLIGTAFLHSVMIQEKRGMLKIWNVSLVLATGVLAILGTFLVRSGILNSIHAFGASTLGVPFLVLIGVLIAGSIALVVSRAPDLRSSARLDSLLSREAVFLLNNLVLVGLCFVIFWGTFFPLISEALTGNEASVGPPWFDRYIVPLSLVLVLLTGIGPVIAWRRATAANLRRNLAQPAAVGVAVVVVLLVAGVTGSVRALLMFGFAAFVIAARRAGAVARRAGAAGDVGRLGAARARTRWSGATGGATAATSSTSGCPCCSRAWRPRRRSRTPATSSSASARRAKVGGYDDHLREADQRPPGGEQRAAREDRPRRGDAGPRGGETVGTLHTVRSLLPVRRPDARAGVALLRGRGDQRGRAPRRAAPRRLERDLAQHPRPGEADRARATRCSPPPPTT